jgi:general secretion pathway protein K
MLVAVLLVALGTILAAAVAYENAMTARRGSATLAFDEALLVSQGSEALAAYGLREIDKTSKGNNFPAQPWAQPIGPVEVVPGVMLEASLEDLEGRFNLNWLVDPGTGKKNPLAVKAFQQLLQILQIEPAWADKVVDWIDLDPAPEPEGAEDSVYLGQNPPYLTANQHITSTSELLALPGFGRDRYVKLAPFISALPYNSKFNYCSAAAPVLDAFAGKPEFSLDPAGLQKNRETAPECFPSLGGYQQTFEDPSTFGKGGVAFESSASQYFRLTSLVTIGTTEFNLYSVLYVVPQANPPLIKPILRSFTPD